MPKKPQNDIPRSELRVAFWGTPEIAVYALDELKEHGIVPALIVTAPDKPRGRKLVVTPPEAKVWAEEHHVPVLQPETLKSADTLKELKKTPWDLFIVLAYGNIMPKNILALPQYGTLNIHPSLLPRLRGASPIQSAILEEDKTGVTVMLMDEEMDHGPVVAQEEVPFEHWPPRASKAEHVLATRGAKLIAENLSDYINGVLKPKAQKHADATFTKKITKEDGLIVLSDDPEKNFRKIQAFDIWPRAYFFTEKNGKQTRVVITDATLEDGQLVIKKVIPEGKKEMEYRAFMS